jgi:hypothetical protein
VCNGHISEEIKGVLWVCNGRPFKTYFGTSYLNDSFFYTHQGLNFKYSHQSVSKTKTRVIYFPKRLSNYEVRNEITLIFQLVVIM